MRRADLSPLPPRKVDIRRSELGDWGVPVEAVVIASTGSVTQTRRYECAFNVRSALGITFVLPRSEKSSPWVWLALGNNCVRAARVSAEYRPRLYDMQQFDISEFVLHDEMRRGFVTLSVKGQPFVLRPRMARTVAWYIERANFTPSS